MNSNKKEIDELLTEEEERVIEAQKYAILADREITVNEDYEKALEYYTKAIELNPKNPEYYIGRARCYKVTERDKEIEDIKKAIELAHSELRYQGMLVRVYSDTCQYDKAMEVKNKMIRTYSDHLGANYGGRSYLYRMLGEYDKALGDLDKAAELTSINLHTNYSRRARIYEILGEYDKALDALDKAIKVADGEGFNEAIRTYQKYKEKLKTLKNRKNESG